MLFYNAILHLYLGINHEINYFFPIFLHIFRQSTKTKVLEVSKSLEKKKMLLKRNFKVFKGKE